MIRNSCSTFRIALLFTAQFCVLAVGPLAIRSVVAQQDTSAESPFDLFNAPIDNSHVYRHFEKTATRMMKQGSRDHLKELQEQLISAEKSIAIDVESLKSFRPQDRESLYEHQVKSTIYIGELYNCGRCDRTHAGFAGGVLVSEDGLAMTNFHVMKSREEGSEGFFAMTWDGRCWAIEQVLTASKNDDVCLIRLKGDGYKFHAAAISDRVPKPTDPIRIVSHPFGEFWVMTHGQVSRYARMRKRRDSKASNRGVWMEVTAPFGSGSSGCGVFNDQGQVVGLVSSIRPMFRSNSRTATDNQTEGPGNQSRYVEMLIRKCVPLDAIRDRFAASGNDGE